MASIDGAGGGGPSRTGATGRPASETSLDEATKGGRTKEKDRFGGLQKRKGALDKTAHATRVLKREQTRVSAPSAKRAQGLTGGPAGGSAAGNKPRAVAQQPQRAQQTGRGQQATQAAAAPPKPQRAQGSTQATPPQVARESTRQAPAKPTRSAASMRRPVGQQRPPVAAQRAGSPRTLPRTIMNVPPAPPTASPRALAGAPPRANLAGSKIVAGYDVLTNAVPERGGVNKQKALSGHDTIARTPRPALRSPGGDKFLQRGADGGGGGFNPAATLGRTRGAGGAGEQPVLVNRRAQAPLPAPPRIGVGTRLLNAIKNIFTFGAYGRAMASRAHSGRVGITLSETALLFASDTHKHLRNSIRDIADSKLSRSEQETYKTATDVIRASLKPIGENVLPDNEYHPEAVNKVASALIAIDKIVFDHTGVAYQAPAEDRSSPPNFPAESAAVSSFPEDRIYETLDEAQRAGQAGGAGSGAGGTGGTGNI